MADSEQPFAQPERRAKTVDCPHCRQTVKIPDGDVPWFATKDREYKPTLHSFRCPECKESIQVDRRRL